MSTYTIINAKRTAPSVSLIMPTHKNGQNHKLDREELRSIFRNAEKQLLDDYPENDAHEITAKLQKSIDGIDLKQLSEGLAIFVSKDNDIVLHLPFPVKEKLIIDNSFEVRDLLYTAKYNCYYTVLTISHNHNKFFYGFNNMLTEVKTYNMPENEAAVEIDHHSKVANFTTSTDVNDVNFEKYLRNIDQALTAELKLIDAPVIVLGVQKTLGLFKGLTHNASKIIGYVEGNFDHTNLPNLYKAIIPVLEQKHKTDQEAVMKKLDHAIDKKNFVSGIENVWAAACEKKGQLLIVEKDYYCTAIVENNRLIVMEQSPDNLSHVKKDAVDDAIELVLRSKGDVAFVENGVLRDHGRIALITYY